MVLPSSTDSILLGPIVKRKLMTSGVNHMRLVTGIYFYTRWAIYKMMNPVFRQRNNQDPYLGFRRIYLGSEAILCSKKLFFKFMGTMTY